MKQVDVTESNSNGVVRVVVRILIIKRTISIDLARGTSAVHGCETVLTITWGNMHVGFCDGGKTRRFRVSCGLSNKLLL